jgi:hypothetical protein
VKLTLDLKMLVCRSTHCYKDSWEKRYREDCNSLHSCAVTAACECNDFRIASNFDIQLIIPLCQDVIRLNTQNVSSII